METDFSSVIRNPLLMAILTLTLYQNQREGRLFGMAMMSSFFAAIQRRLEGGGKHGVYTLTDAEGYYDETGCWHYMIEWEVPGKIWGKDTYREEMVCSPTVYTRMK